MSTNSQSTGPYNPNVTAEIFLAFGISLRSHQAGSSDSVAFRYTAPVRYNPIVPFSGHETCQSASAGSSELPRPVAPPAAGTQNNLHQALSKEIT